MEITIFAKKRQTKEGKSFYGYITTLKAKNGEEVTMGVRFREECGSPKGEKCPCNIIIEKKDVNISRKHYADEETGEVMESKTLWVTNWKPGSEYVDHSTDEFF